jgi:DNA polymerase I
MAVSYVDFEQQEFGVAAKLSNDPTMIAAYTSGDPYLAFAKQAGAVPVDATKSSHSAIRELYKSTSLAIQYGMGLESLAERLDRPTSVARGLLRDHRTLYKEFWRWSDGTIDYAQLNGTLWTTFGWRIGVNSETNPRMLRNFLMQGNGAEMLRLALIGATERGVQICGPVHDAVLVEAPSTDVEQAVALTRAAMAEASRAVLDGFELRTEAKTVHYPDRYSDPRGARMWEIVSRLIGWEGCDVDVPGGVTLASQEVRR